MPVHAWAVETIPLYAVLGVFCALTGIYMIRTNYALSEKLMRWFPKTARERRMKRGCENAAHSERNEIRVVGFLPVKQVEEPFQKKAGKGARKEGRRKEPA